METFTAGSASASCRAARMAPRSSLLSALRFSGRFIVSRLTPGRGVSITSTFTGITLLLWMGSARSADGSPRDSRRSAELDAVFLEGLRAQLEPQSGRVGHGHEPVDDLRALAKQLEPERIARGIGERFEDETGRAGRYSMDVDLRVVVRRERHLVQLGHDRGLLPRGEAARPRRVYDQVVDQPFRHHRAEAERRVLGLAGRDGHVDLRLQAAQRVALVVPGHRVLEPEDAVG